MTSEGRVLIAEDSGVVRALVRSQLVIYGYEVVEAADGADALVAARAQPPDVVLCDVEMPNLDGYGFLAAMQAEPLLAQVPIVFLTGHTDSEQAAEALRRGAHDYLRKPFEPVELAARVHAAMRTKRLQDELRLRNVELERLSATDALTGLYNRRFMQDALARCAAGAGRHGTAWSVVMLDIDRFKHVNDTLGHAVGDAVLRETATRLAGRVRVEDTLARWGGEEFLIALPQTDGRDAATVGESLREIVARTPVAYAGGELAVTISVGWANAGETTVEDVVRRADDALYRAKEGGRNRVCGDASAGAALTIH
jgi:two-component system cell cycle response regulator